MRFFFSGELDVQIHDAYRSTCQEVESRLNSALATSDYGDAILEIGIIPIILSPKFANFRKERRLVKRRDRVADYRLFIDFDAFAHGSEVERRILLVRNVIESIRDIDRKMGSGFDGARLCEDVFRLFPEARK